MEGNATPYMPQVDNYNAIEAYVRRVYNPSGNPAIDQRIIIEPYAYPVNFLDLTAGTPQQTTMQIAANADFVLTDPRYQAVRDVDALTLDPDVAAPLVSILLTDSGSQQQLMSTATALPTYFAHIASAAPKFMYPRIISGRSGLTIQAFNTSDVLTTPVVYPLVSLTFAGVLVRGVSQN
jgi:hypothetical protein